MRLFVALAAVCCIGFVVGCGSSEPSEKQLHDVLSKAPSRPKSHGVGEKKAAEATAGGPAPTSPTGN